MSTVDIWSEHSWGWAIQSQKDFFDEIEPHFSFAVEARALSTFLDALEEQWFRRWPLIPELIARGLLPREAASEGYVLADEQKELVEAHKTRRFKQVQLTLVWRQRVRTQLKYKFCFVDGPRPPPHLMPILPKWP